MEKNKLESEQLAFLYFEVTELWKKLCEAHNELFNVTCDEYSYLLESNLEGVEEKIIEKENIILHVKILENVRQDLINEINAKFLDAKIENVSGLLSFMSKFEVESNQKHLFRFNALLIDIIEKIQTQNKRNQLFVNKALISLKQIRMDALGKKNFETYSKSGSTIQKTT